MRHGVRYDVLMRRRPEMCKEPRGRGLLENTDWLRVCCMCVVLRRIE